MHICEHTHSNIHTFYPLLFIYIYWTCAHVHTHTFWPTLPNSHWQQCPSNYRASCQATEVAWLCVPMVTFSAFVNMVRGEWKRRVWAKLHYRISSYLERANNLWFVSSRYLSWPCTKLPSDWRDALASMGISGLSPRYAGSDPVSRAAGEKQC